MSSIDKSFRAIRDRLLSLLAAVLLCRAEVFSPEAAKSLKAFISSKAGSGGQYGSSAAQAYYATAALAAMDSLDLAEKSSLCSLAQRSISSASSADDTFHAVEIAARLSCIQQLDAAAAAEKALNVLSNARSVDEFYLSIGTLASLHSRGKLPTSTSTSQIAERAQPAWRILQRLILSNGLVRPQAGSPSSIQASGRMYTLLARARNELRLTLPSETVSAINDLWAAIPKVLDGATFRGLSASGDTDWLGAAAAFLTGAADVQATGLDPLQLGHLGRLLANNADAATLQQAAHVATGLKALQAASFPALLEITVLTPAIPLVSKGKMQVRVTDFAGKPVTGATVRASSMSTAEKALLSNAALTAAGAGIYELDVLSATQQPGALALTLQAQPSSSGAVAGRVDVRVLLTDTLTLSAATVAVNSHEAPAAVDSSSISYPDAIDGVLSLDHASSLKVEFSVTAATSKKPFVALQVMLRLVHQGSGTAAFFVAKHEEGSSRFTITATAAGIDKQIGSESGTFEAALLIGDEAASSPLLWPLAQVDVSHAARDDGSAALAPPPRAAAAPALPQIAHLFRQPAPRPPEAVSYLFTGLALAPLGVLVFLLASIGVNVQGFPSSGSKLIATVGFQGSILAVLGLYVVFWLRLDLITMLPILGVLLVVAAVFGYNALSSNDPGHGKRE